MCTINHVVSLRALKPSLKGSIFGSSIDFLQPASSDLGADSALYEKLSNKKLDLFRGFFFFFFFPLGCIELTSFVPFVLMLMMHRFVPFREREREPVKVTREWRKKRENFMAYFLAFGLFCFHVSLILIKTGENWKITNGRGARP